MPAEQLPQIFEPRNTFREMGLLTDASPLGFIASARVLAGPRPESLLVLVGISMRNRGLTFRRDGETFVADYHVEVSLRSEGQIVARASRDERVRVPVFRETQRSDESVIFQQFLPVQAGSYVLAISVRDRNSPNAGEVQSAVVIPALRSSAVSLPIAVYEARPRTSLSEAPSLVLNPRGSVQFGGDSLRFYLETYNLVAGSHVRISAVDGTGRVAWEDSVPVDSAVPLQGFVRAVSPERLSIGRYDLQLSRGGTVLASSPIVVMFSEQFAIANLEDIVSLLRYFPARDSVRALLQVPPEERAAAWRRFWQRSDPNPVTPDNEAVEEYLARLQVANERFGDEGVAGWLTERGEVFINLGDPDEILDRRADFQGRGRYIVWNYYDERLSLTFIDDAGFGRYRLDPASRSEYLRVLNRTRDR